MDNPQKSTPDPSLNERVDDALSGVFPIVTSWVLSVETIDENGNPRLESLFSKQGTVWTQTGQVQFLADSLGGILNLGGCTCDDED